MNKDDGAVTMNGTVITMVRKNASIAMNGNGDGHDNEHGNAANQERVTRWMVIGASMTRMIMRVTNANSFRP